MRGQLKDASSVTFKAYSAFRRELDPDLELMGSGLEGSEEVVEETQMSQAITIMKPILRFLQLLCENHNRDLQVLCDSSCLKFCLGYRLCVSARCVNGNVSHNSAYKDTFHIIRRKHLDVWKVKKNVESTRGALNQI